MAIISKANNTNALNLTTSWTGGVVPGTNAVAQWNFATALGTTNMGAALTFGALSNIGTATTLIPATGGFTLTLSGNSSDAGYVGYGIKSEVAGSNTSTVNIQAPVSIPNAQIWSSLGGSIVISGVLSGAGKVTIDAVSVQNTYGGVSFFSNSTHTGTFELRRGAMFAGTASLTTPMGAAANTIFATGSTGAVFIGVNTISATIANNITLTAATLGLGNWSGSSGTATYSGTLALGSATPTLDVQSIGSAIITGPITGTAGFTKSGAGGLWVANATPASNNITGTLTQSGSGGPASMFALGSQTGSTSVNQFPGNGVSVPTLNTAASNDWFYLNGLTQTTTLTNLFTGPGGVCVNPYQTNLNITFGSLGAGTLSGLTGTTAPTGTGTGVNPNSGLLIRATNNTNTTAITAYDLPQVIGWLINGTATATSAAFSYAGNIATPTMTRVEFNNISASFTNLATSTFSFAANQNNANDPITISGGLTRGNDAGGNAVITLQGTHTGNNTISGPITSASSGTLGITKSGVGKWILSGANTYTGGVTLAASGGTLGAYSSGALGATTGAVVINTGSTLEISGGVTLNKVSAALTLGGTGVSNAGAINNISGTNSYTYSGGTLSAATTIQVASGTSLTMTGVLTDGANTYAFTKTGTGELALASANTFTGVMSIVGTLTASVLANGGAASSVGDSTNAATNLLIGTSAAAGTLKHSGAAASTDRNWTAGTAGATIDASGSGVLTMTSTTAPAFSGAGATTITVQGIAGNGTTTFNTYSQPISDNAGAAVGFTKTGTGAWKLTNATINNTGALTISDGVLDLNGTARTLTANIVMSGGTLQNSAATVAPATSITMTGGKITANLTGSGKTLTVSSGTSELAPQANDNANLAGTATLSGGILRLTTESSTIGTTGGKVLGTMATTVQNGATIQTTTGTLQRGQMRYGGNLTFQAGATLRIGG